MEALIQPQSLAAGVQQPAMMDVARRHQRKLVQRVPVGFAISVALLLRTERTVPKRLILPACRFPDVGWRRCFAFAQCFQKVFFLLYRVHPHVVKKGRVLQNQLFNRK